LFKKYIARISVKHLKNDELNSRSRLTAMQICCTQNKENKSAQLRVINLSDLRDLGGQNSFADLWRQKQTFQPLRNTVTRT
jgi:hypothetical protein